ncbi:MULTISPECIES: GNAT family N-acetyltransferase [Bradyrhizobium]|uniref:GNAT family N-acetyltransferase n=1 Tax=Bradyrhizobium elkanii TaxID=29448 RepID=UPI0009B7C30B|nr:GNAT family N-acetyltransferase [Bradyrhizobium elkanii]
MSLLREAEPTDAKMCGTVCFDAFKAIHGQHNLPPDFPSADMLVELLAGLISHRGVYSVVAEQDGVILGSNFLDSRNWVAGVGPITVDPTVQSGSIGRRLMLDVLRQASDRGKVGVRLLVAAFHNRAFCLGSKLGFQCREPIIKLGGDCLNVEVPGYIVRPASVEDIYACHALCVRAHGYDRSPELSDAIALGTARVVEHRRRLVAYASDVGVFGHTVAENNDGLQALVGSAERFSGAGFLLPARNHEMLFWCLARGLRVLYQMNLMTIGSYIEPTGSYLPSAWY